MTILKGERKKGSFSENNISYIYHKSKYAITGRFNNKSNLLEGQREKILRQECNSLGLMTFEYSKPMEDGISYHYNPPNETSFGDQPLVADEVALEYVEVKPENGQPKGTLTQYRNPGTETIVEDETNEAEVLPEDNSINNQVTSQNSFFLPE